MILYRSTLLLVTSVTCLGFIPISGKNFSGVEQAIATLPTRSQSLELAQGSSPNAADAQPVLTVGSQGLEVAELQKALKRLGHYDGAVDGVYGRTTAVAVSKFQTSAGLAADGVAGSTTRENIKTSLAAQPKPSPIQKPKAAKPRPNPLLWALGLTLASAGVGLAVYFFVSWLKKATRDEEEPEASSDVSDEINYLDLEDASNNGIDTHIQPLENDSKNGFHSPVFTVLDKRNPEEGITPQPPKETTPPIRETTRLAKIDIVEELVKDLQGNDLTKRRKAIWELAQRGDSRAVQPLVDLLMDSDSQQRGLILEALSQIGTRTLKPMNRALAISLQDESPEVRKNAIRDLTRIYDTISQVSQLLRLAAEDQNSDVQETARWAMGQLNRIRSIPGADNKAALPNSPEDKSDERSQ
ncbi:HEAT repeat domain-containing protein [Trichocoleus sp. FACHB-90]|uniref:peptidoglycan-binding protein n=1 Tax=Cyanophyceae TaxID=3028117 RepID=UPI001683E575|nr:peptidoglycan-binding protein [Trichocoleus sp. FACHB-90]MBD1927772.1 HEAT repeat domain-containing protein [Trichocoleus sp. FACHB-90]